MVPTANLIFPSPPASLEPTNPDPLHLESAAEVARIVASLREQVGDTLKRRGLVLGMSGGVDSSVCAALAVQAFGPKHVLGLFMPERDSDPLSLSLAREWADELGVPWVIEDIGPICDALGCYRRRDAAIREVIPEFTSEWKFKIVLPGNRLDSDRLNVFSIHAVAPDGTVVNQRLKPETYREIVAATNFKQRVRKMMEYYHADRMHYAVIGTPNRLEYDQGFFVKGGDGLADVKPIAHLYKTQVYQLATYLNVLPSVTDRPPTTDTYSLPQTQEEFYFALPTKLMDLALFYRNSGMSTEAAAEVMGLRPEQVERAYRDIDQKRSTTRYLHSAPLLVEDVLGLHARRAV